MLDRYGYLKQVPGPGKERPWRPIPTCYLERVEDPSRRPLDAPVARVFFFAGVSPRR